MIYTILLIVLVVGALVVLGWLVWRKWPQLRIVDPSSSKESRSRQLKYTLMRQRVERASGKHVDAISSKVVKPIGTGVQTLFRRLAGKLTAVERAYQERQKKEGGKKIDAETMKRLLADGKKLMAEESWDEAEKKFIEVISNEPKNIEAYERLGRLYILRKDLELAEQTFQFLMKLSPDDPSVIAALGEIEDRLGRHKKAFSYFQKAHELSPNNPKYLDFLIDASIQMNEKVQALEALEQLKTVNPQNQKIPLFEKHIGEIDMVSTNPEDGKKKKKKTK